MSAVTLPCTYRRMDFTDAGEGVSLFGVSPIK